MTNTILTQDRLKNLLNYNPHTGLFTWIVDRSSKTKKYSLAGAMADGYIRIGIDNKRYQAHRLAWLYMTGSWPELQIDHIDTIKSNNKWENLRQATASQNKINSPISMKNKSGIKGVHFSKKRKSWIVQCCKNGINVRVGEYKDINEAKFAYETFAKKYHGEFYRI